jgi:uncharacterized protein YyaL (SSP411 family)
MPDVPELHAHHQLYRSPVVIRAILNHLGLWLVRSKPPKTHDPLEIARIARFTKGLRMIDGKATAYVCIHNTCKLPTTDINKMVEFFMSKQIKA